MSRFAVWASLLCCAALGASGCACDPDREARRLAGTRATDCGFATLDGDMGAVRECLDAALVSGTPAYGGWATGPERQQFYVVRPDRTYGLSYDGSKDELTISPCIGMPVRLDEGYTCDGELQDPYDFCD